MGSITSKSIEISGSTIEYYVSGNGDAVLLLHGAATSSMENWKATIDSLTRTRKVIAINFPGAGESKWTAETIEITDLGLIVQHILQTEKIAQYDVVGFSTGAMLALHLGASQEAGIKKLIAIAPWLKDGGRSQLFFETWGTIYKTDPELFHRYNALNFLSGRTLGLLSREALESSIQSNIRSNIHKDMAKIIKMNETLNLNDIITNVKARTLIIGFSDDRITLVKNAREIANLIPAATYIEIEAGHAGPWEATERMNQVVLKFLYE